MVGVADLKRILAPMQRKIFMLIGRAVLTAIDDASMTQKLQLKLLADEVATGVERFEEYGLASYPWEDAQVLAGFINGNRDHGIVICVHDRRYRPDYLTQGEVVLFTDEDKTTPFRVHLKRGRILNLKCTDLDIDVTGNETKDIGGNVTRNIGGSVVEDITGNLTEDVGGNKIENVGVDKTENITGDLTINFATATINGSGALVLSGASVLLGDGAAGSNIMLDSIIAIFNAHIHSGVTTGSGDTSAPTTAYSASNATTKTKAN